MTNLKQAIEMVVAMAKKIDPKNAEYILNDYRIIDKTDDLQRSFNDGDEWGISYYTDQIKEEITQFDENRLCPSNVEVGQGVTQVLFSDRKAFTIIKKTAQSITIQRDKATKTFTPEFVSGGFAGHCTNNDDQTYDYEPNPNGETITYRWSKKHNCYRNNYSSLSKGRREKYDYNF